MAMNFVNTGVNSAKHDTQELFEALQAERSGQLAAARDLQLAARLLMQAEARRLARKAPADPRAATLATLDGAVRERLSVLDTELEIAAIRAPVVTKTQALVHGRITDDARRAPGPVSVQLVRADGSAVPGTRPVEVDASGYYAIVLDEASAAALQPNEALSVVVQRDDARVAPSAGANFTLGAGAVAVKDVALSGSELQALRLRVPLDLGNLAAGGVLRPRGAAPAPKPKAPAKTKTTAKTSRAKPRKG